MFCLWKQALVTALLLGFPLNCLTTKTKPREIKFGPYYASALKVQRCHPKSFNGTLVLSNYSIVRMGEESEEYRGFLNFTADLPITKGYISSKVLERSIDNYSDFTQEILRPCRGVVFSYILDQFLHPIKDCIVKKGNYKISVSPNEVIHRFFQTLQYGKFRFTLEFHSGNTIIICFDFDIHSKTAKVVN